MNDSQNQTPNGPSFKFSPIKVDKMIDGMGTSDVALLRQTVTSTYPGVRPGNSLSSSLFDSADFGATEQVFTNDRTALVKVPKGSTEEDVQAKIDALENPKLYRIMSLNHEDCMTEEQKSASAQGISDLTIEDYKERLLAKNPETEEPLLYNGEQFYRAVYFSSTPVEDVDLRPEQLAASEGAVEVGRPESVEEAVATRFDG